MSEYLPPYLSLDVPIPPPGPDEGPVCFTFDAKWLPYIIAVVKTLTLDGVYASDQDNAKGAASILLELFLSAGQCSAPLDLSGSEMDDCMGCCIRMRNGVLQVLQCGEWVTVDGWDTSQIAPAQPGSGSPQPAPGGCTSFTGIISPTGGWLLPVPVNTGDTITVKNLLGAWSPSAFTDVWDCPDGNLYFAGGCISGTAGFDAGAPMPSAPLNGTICFDGTNYYDVSAAAQENNPVTFTIAAGIANKQLLVRSNFHGGVDPSGEVSFDIEICNNAPPTWSHTFDFTLTDGGFHDYDGMGTGHGGLWVAGTGWTPATIAAGLGQVRWINIRRAVSSRDVKSAFYTVSYTPGTQPAAQPVQQLTTDGVNYVFNLSPTEPTGTNLTLGQFLDDPAAINWYLLLQTDDTAGVASGTTVLKSLTITGVGSDPF